MQRTCKNIEREKKIQAKFLENYFFGITESSEKEKLGYHFDSGGGYIPSISEVAKV